MKKFVTFKKLAVLAMVGISIPIILSGCATVANVGAQVGQAAGVFTPEQAEAIARSGQDITPEQEYFIGRTVGATIINTYKVYDKPDATSYINVLGQSVSRFSDMPETFRGYSFLILDTDEINAFAAPGGFIFISRGMIRLCRTEDDLAAVLAHEIGHIQHRHAIKAINSGRLTSAFTILAVAGAKTLGSSDLAAVTEAFEGSITDITSTLMKGGYARGQEREADRAAITILKRMGYRQQSLIDVLSRMDQVLKTDKRGFGSTHPPASSRIAELKPLVNDTQTPVPTALRQKRFDAFRALL